MARRPIIKGLSEPRTRYRTLGQGARRRGEAASARRKLPKPETLPDGTVRYFLVLGPKGRVLLPADLRAGMGLKEGDVITAWLKDGEMRMHSHLHGLRKIQVEASAIAKDGAYASEELIAERRAEAAKEDEETLQWLRDRRKR